jgi:hypothetical protein
VSEHEIARLWGSLTAQRMELEQMKQDMRRREQDMLDTAARLQLACHLNRQLEQLQ